MLAVVASVSGAQVLVNLKFIEALVSFLQESTKPLTAGEVVDTGEEEEEEEEEEERREAASRHQVASRTQSVVEKGKESKMSVSVKVVHPLVALLEDARQMDSPALVCQVSTPCCSLTTPSLVTQWPQSQLLCMCGLVQIIQWPTYCLMWGWTGSDAVLRHD